MSKVGSRKRERNFKYTYGEPDAASHGQRDIPLTGADGAYFAVKKCDNGILYMAVLHAGMDVSL